MIIILLHFATIYTVEVIYVYCTYIMELLFNSVLVSISFKLRFREVTLELEMAMVRVSPPRILANTINRNLFLLNIWQHIAVPIYRLEITLYMLLSNFLG